MQRRALSLIAFLLIVSAMPLSASQFIDQAFDDVAREAKFIVRGSVIDTWSAWNDDHDVIFTYATVRVSRYFGERTGPDTLLVREVGGTVAGYTQEAIGFPAIRRAEQVVLLLTGWGNSTDLPILSVNQGKYLVRQRGDFEVLVSDPVTQGEERLAPAGPRQMATEAEGLSIEEFAGMVDSARAGEMSPRTRNQQ